MRITSGIFGGRNLLVPKTEDIRPTQDRVREALFSMLMAVVPGAEVLDLFAGTGAFGLEAISRGAKSATFVEQNRKHVEVLKKNCEAIFRGQECPRPCDIVCADATKFNCGRQFDVVFMDPPYAMWGEIAPRVDLVKDGGILILESDGRGVDWPCRGVEVEKDRTYGKTRILIYRKVAENA